MAIAQDTQNEDKTLAPKPPPMSVPERYESPFMKLIAPFIATRYLVLAIEDINPKDFLGKRKQEPNTLLGKIGRYTSRNFAAFGMGLSFLGAMLWYSKNTLQDIKSLYSEAVGYELDKKPDDVGLMDLLKSDNAALAVTRSAYIKRTLARFATAATFFVPWHKFRGLKDLSPKYDANANAGVGAVGGYLLGEALVRDKSFFDAEQSMVNATIHHNDANPNQSISSMDIKRLLLLQRKHLNKNYEWPTATSQEGKDQLALAERIASLMNQTFHNDPNIEQAHLTLGKFNYLVGFGLLDNPETAQNFVELANKSADMSDVKQAATAIRHGQDAQLVFQKFGIELAPKILSTPAAPEAEHVNFTDKFQPRKPLDFATAPPANTQLSL